MVPGSTQGVSALRGTAPVSAQSESKFGAYSAFAAVSAAAVLSAGHKKHVGRKHMACNFSKESQIGAMDPVGFFDPASNTNFFDPAGLCTDEATFKDFRIFPHISAPRRSSMAGRPIVFGVFFCWVHRLYNYFILICTHEQFSWWYLERRLAMMGALGMLTQSLVQLPGFEGVPKDVTARSNCWQRSDRLSLGDWGHCCFGSSSLRSGCQQGARQL